MEKWRCVMPRVEAQIPEEIYKNILKEIELGIFSNESEAVVSALKKSYARKSRSFLKWLMKKEGITEDEMLKALKKIRK